MSKFYEGFHDFIAADDSFALRFDRGRNSDGTYSVIRWDAADGQGRHIAKLHRESDLKGRRFWLIRALNGELLVSAADGIGPGSCPNRDEAVTVLGWKFEKAEHRLREAVASRSGEEQ